MNPALSKLSHVAYVTPNLEKSLWFYTDILGMNEVATDGTTHYLRCFGELDHHSITLREGPEAAVDHVAFRVGGPNDLAAYTEQLTADGVTVSQVPAGTELGQGDAIRFIAPHSQARIELVWNVEKPLAPEAERSHLPSNSSKFGRGVGVRRIDHANISTSVAQLGLGEEFLTSGLGLKRREAFQPTASPLLASWLSVTPQVHDIAIAADPQDLPGGYHHTALTMDSPADLLRAADIIREHDIEVDVWPGRHGISQAWFFYLRDPGSGHRIELFAGGYQIFDPDWEPIMWDEKSIEYGAIWYGPEFEMAGEGPMNSTTRFTATSLGVTE